MLDTTEHTTKIDVAAAEGHDRPKRGRYRLPATVLAVIVAAGGGLAAFGILGRQETEAKVAEWTSAQAVPTVNVVAPERGTTGQELVLPGDIEAYYEAPIYARVPGYLKMWYFDIGARVKAGQELAVIDTPDLDQQLVQAQHDLASVQAAAKLAQLTAVRWQNLLASQSVSRQTADEKSGDATAKLARVAASEANVARLRTLENFKHLTAPFDGVVTARETDIGALINAGSGSGVELFKVADMHKMRVYVRVPQAYAGQLHRGLEADLKLVQYPDKVFPARLETMSNAIAKDSRTVLVELLADNPDGKLWPGTFAEVHFKLPADPNVYRLPTSSLVFREHGLQIATVGANGRADLKSVTPGRDLGTEIEILSGLDPSDRVIANPPDSLSTGDHVKVAGTDPAGGARTAMATAPGDGEGK